MKVTLIIMVTMFPIYAFNTLPLNVPTDVLMSLGGDDRMLINTETGFNKYLTHPAPHTDIITRSSCTASFPTIQAFNAAQQAHQKLLQAEHNELLDEEFAHQMHDIRTRIAQAFIPDHYPSQTYLLTAPSGTTTEMFFTFLALARSQTQKNTKQKYSNSVVNIIVAAGEVGSKSDCSAQCRHFSSKTPRGTHVTPEYQIAGIAEDSINLVQIPVRNPHTGMLEDLSELETTIEHLLNQAIMIKNQIVILHLVQASKTGLFTPRIDFIKRMKKQFGKSLLVVVDAAQYRCKEGMISEYLDANFCVFLTGSKFFSGPPFSGVIFLPKEEAEALEDEYLIVPSGLGDYFTSYDCDPRLKQLQKKLPSWKNYGLLLRWHTALYEIEHFMNIPIELRNNIIRDWVYGAKNLINTTTYIHSIDEKNNFIMTDDAMLAGNNTIITFTLHPRSDHTTEENPLNEAALKEVLQWLTQDISTWLPENCSEQDRTVAQQKYLTGQPIKLTSGKQEIAGLRIGLGAPLVNFIAQQVMYENKDIENCMKQILFDDQALLHKLSLIGKHYHIFKKGIHKK